MRVLALTRYDDAGASSRYRVYQYLPGLRAAGVEIDVMPLLGDGYVAALYAQRTPRLLRLAQSAFKRIKALSSWRRYDLIWLEKELFPYGPGILERFLRLTEVPVIVDYDDAIFHKYDRNRSALVRAVLSRKIDRVMNACTLVVAGNEYLASRARAAGAPAVAVLPTVIDLRRYPLPGPRPIRASLTVGWIGSPTTQEYLRLVAPALAAFVEEFGASVHVIGARADFSLPGVPLNLVPWNEKTEVEELSRLDIGIMPLHDDPWSRGKCGLKLIQYMGCGLPVVASPVGVNSDIVRNGETGFLASAAKDWLTALRVLGRNEALRTAMGAAGRTRVESLYSLQVALPRIQQLFSQAVGLSASGQVR